jgi:hypothetical protein
MENTVQIPDDELREITQRALEKHFDASDIDQIEIKLEKRDPPSNQDQEVEPAIVSVWVMHLARTFIPDPRSTMNANIEMWNKLKEMSDNRTFLLFHGFPNDPSRPKKAA